MHVTWWMPSSLIPLTPGRRRAAPWPPPDPTRARGSPAATLERLLATDLKVSAGLPRIPGPHNEEVDVGQFVAVSRRGGGVRVWRRLDDGRDRRRDRLPAAGGARVRRS